LILGVVAPALAFGGGVGGGYSGGGGGGGGIGGGGGGFGGGGGIPFPMFFPFMGFGGSAIVPILIFLFFVWLNRQSQSGGRLAAPSRPSEVNLVRLEIGLLATAKDVPTSLHQLVSSVDTSSNYGLSQLLQQSALLLMRNRQFWHAASYSFRGVHYDAAESAFNSLTMEARSKLSYETITNVGGVHQVDTSHQLPAPADSLPPGDYVVVVLIVATSAPIRLKAANTAAEIADQLADVASSAGSNLHGVEVIWQPDSSTESLSRDDVVTMYPELAPI
jgi:uncharacterized membrane protein